MNFSADNHERRARRVALIPAAAFLLLAALAGPKLVRMHGVPYNIQEVVERAPALTLATLAAMLLAAGAIPVALALFWRAQPVRFAYLAAPIIAALGTVAFTALFALVPVESLDDIVGFPTLGINGTFERYIRFVGLFAGPIAALTVGARLVLSTRGNGLIDAGLGISLLLMVISYVVVVPLAATDNVIELLRGDGGLVSAIAMAGYFILLGAVIALLPRSLIRVPVRLPAVCLALFIAGLSVPASWGLFVAATTPRLEKYGKVFSGRQFLLSPDREHYLDDRAIAARFFLLQIGLTLVLASGACLTIDREQR